MSTMKAARIQAWGGSDVVTIEEVERPQPGPDQVLIQIRAASVNPVDWKIREGYLRDWFPLPQILGQDAAGDIAAVGTNVTNFKIGDAVYGNPRMTFAEFAVANAAEIALKPTTLDYLQTAAVPVAALTAWRALVDGAKLNADKRVLVHGAAGGVGNFGVQFAKIKGAYVIGTASANNETFVRELGANEFIDYRTIPFEDVAKDMDVVFDTIGGETLERSYAIVKRGGILVTVAGQPSPEKAAQHGIQAIYSGAQASTAVLSEVANLIDSGKVKVYVNKVFPFAELKQALDLNQTGHTRGKIVVQIRN